ncbi:hypothetical protein E2C01_029849 [Portunus trituberculatus]|uniref:Uncharacterized protein n=1 Tax=Portunus trituberculatus TaxID=210409 RepID=A0A5B7EU17_PORTR|nr:hypothetical protein [Portunus trituberculatus]
MVWVCGERSGRIKSHVVFRTWSSLQVNRGCDWPSAGAWRDARSSLARAPLPPTAGYPQLALTSNDAPKGKVPLAFCFCQLGGPQEVFMFIFPGEIIICVLETHLCVLNT